MIGPFRKAERNVVRGLTHPRRLAALLVATGVGVWALFGIGLVTTRADTRLIPHTAAETPPAWALTPNGRWVHKVFVDFARDASYSETQYIYTNEVDHGTPRQDVAWDVIGHVTVGIYLIESWYWGYLGRMPSQDEETYWWDTMARTGDVVGVEAAISGSDEFFHQANSSNLDFITLLYQRVLDRDPDASGFTYWRDLLASGTSRLAVARVIVDSGEAWAASIGGSAQSNANGPRSANAIVTPMNPCQRTDISPPGGDLLTVVPGSGASGSYCNILNRPASSSEISSWTSALKGDKNGVLNLWLRLAISSEYYRLAQS